MDIKSIQFYKDVKSELRKVKWSTKKEMWKDSLAVVAVTCITVLFFLASDFIIQLVQNIFK